MNHKRKRPKNRRAGCLLCKPYKMNGYSDRHRNMQFGDLRRLTAFKADEIRKDGKPKGQW